MKTDRITTIIIFEIEDTESTVEVVYDFTPGAPADTDEYGRPTEFPSSDEVEIVSLRLVEGELAPTDDEVLDAINEDDLPEYDGWEDYEDFHNN